MRRILKLALVVAAATSALCLSPGQAADPPDGVVSPEKPVYTWESTGVSGVNVMNNVNTETEGAVSNCYSAELEPHLCVVQDIEYKGTERRQVVFKVDFEVYSDYDMYLYDSKGELIGESTAGITTQSTGETIQSRLLPGRYRLELVKYYAAHSTVKGTVTLKK